MASVFATKNGNWNDITVWNTGALPATTDDVYANGFTITINQNINILSIRTAFNTGINAGGGFILNSAFNLSCNIIAGSTVCLLINATTGFINVVGDATGGTVLNAYAINASTTAVVNHTGSVFGSSGQNSFGCYVAGITTYNLTGNCLGGSGSSAHGLTNVSGGTVAIIGNVVGGTQGFGCNNATTGSINVIGSCIAGAVSGATNQASGTLIVSNAVASTGSSASVAGITGISISGTTAVKFATWGSNGQNPLAGFVRFQNLPDVGVSVPRIGSTAVTLQDITNVANVIPAASNVRAGVSYNAGNNVGTLVVPAASNVRRGISTDNTIGTADLTAADFWSYANRTLTNFNDAQIAELAKESTLGLIKTKVDTLNNADLTTLAKEDTLMAVRESIENIEVDNVAISAQVWEDMPERLKKVSTFNDAQIAELAKESTLGLIKTKVDTLNNADLTTLAKEDTLMAVRESIENIEVDNVAISAQVWEDMPERLKKVSTVESVVAQLVGLL